jgi:hypothetical protein
MRYRFEGGTMKADYIKINLNKASNRIDQFEQSQKRKRVASTIMFFVVIIVIIGVMGYKSYEKKQVIDTLRAELTEIENKIAELESSSDYLSPEDIFTLSEVTKNRLIWSEKIAVIGNILPKDVAITELNFDSRLNAFVIKGVSKVKPNMKDLDLVVAIINIVKSQDDFASDFIDIKFQSSQRFKHNEQEIVKFSIACLAKS